MPETVCNLEKLNLTIDGKSPGMLIVNAVYRARVRGGWLVLAGHNNGIGGVTFYPDQKHEWKGDSLPG
jgi:hypothetical protein